MTRRTVLLASMILCGCGTSAEAPDASRARQASAASSIPRGPERGFRDGYRVQVSRRDGVSWNGRKVDDATLSAFLDRYAKLPKDAGRLWIEFEPGLRPQTAAAVRRRIAASGICERQGCVEGAWGADRPVVN